VNLVQLSIHVFGEENGVIALIDCGHNGPISNCLIDRSTAQNPADFFRWLLAVLLPKMIGSFIVVDIYLFYRHTDT